MYNSVLTRSEHAAKDTEGLEFQLFGMQDNLKEIAKRWHVAGIDQTKEDNWVVVYAQNDGDSCKVMLNDCESAYRGTWDFSIHATYCEDSTIHTGDIKGPDNKRRF